jgi:hypothetical protein
VPVAGTDGSGRPREPFNFPCHRAGGYDRAVDAPRDLEGYERARRGFAAELDRLTPVHLTDSVREELVLECAPVLETLLAALERQGGGADGEALALTALFGRRVATLGETPSSALAALDALLAATRDAGHRPTTEFERAVRSAAMEGFTAAVDERARAQMTERAAQSLVPVIVAPRVLLLVISGCEDADAISIALARLGRAALDADAAACIVHSTFPAQPERDVALEIAAFDSSATMIGARAIFSGTPFALAALRAQAPNVTVAETFDEALRRALDAAEQVIGPASLLARGLKRLKR